jgi:hypothetical protein
VSDWDESLAEVVDDMASEPLNVHKLMAHNPALFKAWWDFRNHSVSGGALGKRSADYYTVTHSFMVIEEVLEMPGTTILWVGFLNYFSYVSDGMKFQLMADNK